jgi:putative OPT family oligopeptide transporter
MAPVLTLLLTAYGIGTPTAEHPNPLAAPQASLMAAVARGVFAGGLPWGMVGVGMGLAAIVIGFDAWLARRNASFRAPVLAAAVGLYLPLELQTAIFLGGLIAWATGRTWMRRAAGAPGRVGTLVVARTRAERNGLLFAAGLITGEALIGIVLAVPIVIAGRGDVLAFWGTFGSPWPGVALLAAVVFLLHRAAVAGRPRPSGIV